MESNKELINLLEVEPDEEIYKELTTSVDKINKDLTGKHVNLVYTDDSSGTLLAGEKIITPSKDNKNIFDDSKIESHSALTPTYKIPNKTQLSEREMQVYSTVFRRFVAVFCAEDCVVTRSEITIAVGDLEIFVLKGMVVLEKGWTKYDDYTQKDKVLPALQKGDRVNIDFKPTEKETQPPKHYTIETLNNYLKNPFKEEKNAAKEKVKENDEPNEFDDEDDYKAIFEGLELGTEATRTGIIDNARKSEYILLKKDVYTILPDGEYLIEALLRLGISMDKYKTSEMGKALKMNPSDAADYLQYWVLTGVLSENGETAVPSPSVEVKKEEKPAETKKVEIVPVAPSKPSSKEILERIGNCRATNRESH